MLTRGFQYQSEKEGFNKLEMRYKEKYCAFRKIEGLKTRFDENRANNGSIETDLEPKLK